MRIVLKSDAHGTLTTIRDELSSLGEGKARINIVRAGVGDVVTSDVFLAATTKSTILGFGVSLHKQARPKDVPVELHQTIYEIKKAALRLLEGVIEPEIVEIPIGKVGIKKIIKSSKLGRIAGCFVAEGVVRRNSQIRVMREDIVLWQGGIKSLKRFNEDANEVRENFECGIRLNGFTDLKAGDELEAIEVKKVKHKLTRQETNDERSSGSGNKSRRRRGTREATRR